MNNIQDQTNCDLKFIECESCNTYQICSVNDLCILKQKWKGETSINERLISQKWLVDWTINKSI